MLLTTTVPGADERFQMVPGVDMVSSVDGCLTIRGTGTDLVTQTIRCLADNRMTVTEFRAVLPTLEDVFLALTGHAIRD